MTTARTSAQGGRALAGVGFAAILLGAFAWAWDVDPTAGRVLLVVGALSAVAGWAIARSDLGSWVSRALMVVAVVLAVVVAVEAGYLIELFQQQHAAYAA